MISPATKDPGPLSAIFNYEDLKKEEEARKLQKEEAQKKIMRTNAIGDALRLLIESVGASQGATVTPRAENPSILKATDELRNINNAYDANMRGLRLQDIAYKAKDLERQQQLSDVESHRAWNEGQTQKAQDFQREQTRTSQDFQRDMADKNIESQRATERFRTDENIREAQAKYDINREELNRQVPRNKARTEADIPFVIPGTTQTIYIRPEEIQEMQYQLVKDKDRYSPELDAALKALMKNELVRDPSVVAVLKKHWDTIKYVLPEYAGQKPEEKVLTPKEKRAALYDTEVEKINTDPSLNARQRVKKIGKLTKEYGDLFTKEPDDIVKAASFNNGVQDLSVFNN